MQSFVECGQNGYEIFAIFINGNSNSANININHINNNFENIEQDHERQGSTVTEVHAEGGA